MNNLKNHNGFTLIEALASITILGIVLTVFLSFFSNSMTFSVKAEDKLTAINLAEKELYDITNSIEAYCRNNDCKEPDSILDNYTRPDISLNNKTYLSTVTPLSQNSEEISLGLLPISITINLEEGNKELTTVYGYAQLNTIKQENK